MQGRGLRPYGSVESLLKLFIAWQGGPLDQVIRQIDGASRKRQPVLSLGIRPQDHPCGSNAVRALIDVLLGRILVLKLHDHKWITVDAHL